MHINAVLEASKIKTGAPGIEKIYHFLDKSLPKPKKKVPQLKKSVYGVSE